MVSPMVSPDAATALVACTEALGRLNEADKKLVMQIIASMYHPELLTKPTPELGSASSSTEKKTIKKTTEKNTKSTSTPTSSSTSCSTLPVVSPVEPGQLFFCDDDVLTTFGSDACTTYLNRQITANRKAAKAIRTGRTPVADPNSAARQAHLRGMAYLDQRAAYKKLQRCAAMNVKKPKEQQKQKQKVSAQSNVTTSSKQATSSTFDSAFEANLPDLSTLTLHDTPLPSTPYSPSLDGVDASDISTPSPSESVVLIN